MKYQVLRLETKTLVREFPSEQQAKDYVDKVDPYGLFTELRVGR